MLECWQRPITGRGSVAVPWLASNGDGCLTGSVAAFLFVGRGLAGRLRGFHSSWLG